MPVEPLAARGTGDRRASMRGSPPRRVGAEVNSKARSAVLSGRRRSSLRWRCHGRGGVTRSAAATREAEAARRAAVGAQERARDGAPGDAGGAGGARSSTAAGPDALGSSLGALRARLPPAGRLDGAKRRPAAPPSASRRAGRRGSEPARDGCGCTYTRVGGHSSREPPGARLGRRLRLRRPRPAARPGRSRSA